jgi:nucleotide-binding universal stress UspA family protein
VSVFSSVLLPLDGSLSAARGVGCATWLATRLDAHLHVLGATPRRLPAAEELARLRVPEAIWPRILLHQANRPPEDAILDASAEHAVDLIILSTQGESADRGQPLDKSGQQTNAIATVGHVTRAVIERSAVPVLLLPPGYREALPWKEVLVPLSGESESDEALALAVAVANSLALRVHVTHVLEKEAGRAGLTSTARYADALHHEYPQQMAALVRRSLPEHTSEACHCIADIAVARGDVAMQLLEQIREKDITLLVIGWHGRFSVDRAQVLKRLLAAIACPILLVKPAQTRDFQLKVGPGLA